MRPCATPSRSSRCRWTGSPRSPTAGRRGRSTAARSRRRGLAAVSHGRIAAAAAEVARLLRRGRSILGRPGLSAVGGGVDLRAAVHVVVRPAHGDPVVVEAVGDLGLVLRQRRIRVRVHLQVLKRSRALRGDRGAPMDCGTWTPPGPAATRSRCRRGRHSRCRRDSAGRALPTVASPPLRDSPQSPSTPPLRKPPRPQ